MLLKGLNKFRLEAFWIFGGQPTLNRHGFLSRAHVIDRRGARQTSNRALASYERKRLHERIAR